MALLFTFLLLQFLAMTTPAKTYIRLPDLSDKTVVITGASSGAGRATAIEFARHGAKIVLAARNKHALEQVSAECKEFDALALPVQTDVTNADEVKRLATIAHEFGGAIDVWVNNAGVLSAGEFDCNADRNSRSRNSYKPAWIHARRPCSAAVLQTTAAWHSH